MNQQKMLDADARGVLRVYFPQQKQPQAARAKGGTLRFLLATQRRRIRGLPAREIAGSRTFAAKAAF
jgi:hypothetical protein